MLAPDHDAETMPSDEVQTTPPPRALVVIAASAGRIEALSQVLGALPADFPGATDGVQYVLDLPDMALTLLRLVGHPRGRRTPSPS